MLYKILLLSLLLELFTVVSRVVFGSMKDRYRTIKFRYKVRIHHGYIGLLLILLYGFYPQEVFLILGGALFLSDALHHFVVLPIWVKRTEFP